MGGICQIPLDEVVGLVVYLLEQTVEVLFQGLEPLTLEQRLTCHQFGTLEQHHGLLVGLTSEDELVPHQHVLSGGVLSAHLNHGLQV